MVCEKNAAVDHDFMADPLRLLREGDWIKADGTTLGSDNGKSLNGSWPEFLASGCMEKALWVLLCQDLSALWTDPSCRAAVVIRRWRAGEAPALVRAALLDQLVSASQPKSGSSEPRRALLLSPGPHACRYWRGMRAGIAGPASFCQASTAGMPVHSG
jgi:hypothetical protein